MALKTTTMLLSVGRPHLLGSTKAELHRSQTDTSELTLTSKSKSRIVLTE